MSSINLRWVAIVLALVLVKNFGTLGQIRLVVTQVPSNTPPQDDIYMTGSFNNWQAADPDFRLKRAANGNYQIKLNLNSPITFQFCRGESQKMEGGISGQSIPSRVLIPADTTISTTILGWVDLEYYEIRLTHLPINTPEEDSIFIAGSFNDWIAGDSKYRLIPGNDGSYSVKIPAWMDTLEYKYNRGTWPTVEGDDLGRIRANRNIFRTQEPQKVYYDQISSWEDLEGKDTYTFVITDYPGNTPFDASIYLVGNFNDWQPGHPDYRFTRHEDNSFRYTLRDAPHNISYKFTRGTWESVEGGWDGRAIQNRVYNRDQLGPIVINTNIKSWEDITGSSINYNDFVLIIAAVIAVLLILGFHWIESPNLQANRLLVFALILCVIAWLSRVLTNFRDVFNWEPRLVLLPDIIYFTYAPLMYFYVQALLSIHPRLPFSKRVSFIPAGLLFLCYLPMLALDAQTFSDKIVNREYHGWFALVGGVALAYNAFYWIRSLRVLQAYTRKMEHTQSFDQGHYFLNSLLTLNATCMFAWLAAYVIGTIGYFLDWNHVPASDTAIDITWVLFAGTPFLVAYFAVSEPELFRKTEVPEKYKYSNLTDESASRMKNKLNDLMVDQKPFLNPKLTLLELAEMLETNTNTLSRVINEGYGCNFYDYVNKYRIEEFKKLVNQDNYKNLTFLGIAYEVGFNSKTTFNRAFKKLEGITPREYYREVLAFNE